MRKYDKVSAFLSFSPKPLVFMYQEAISIFLGSTMS